MKKLFLTFWALVSMACGADQPRSVSGLFQTPENLLVVASPERIEACMLYVRKPWFSRKSGERSYKEGKYKLVSVERAQVLTSKLLDEKTYKWDSEKLCMPEWNARVKFFRAGHYISADFCFGCDILVLSRDGQPFSGEDFDAASEPIFEIVRALFPEDRVVRKILDRKEQMREAMALHKRALELEEQRKSSASSAQ